MKKIVISIITLLMFSSSLFAQNDDEQVNQKRNELKFNVFNALVFKTLDGSYEFLIDEESSVGISLLANFQEKNNGDEFIGAPIYQERFALTPFYRRYFSSKYAWGFFIEGFGMFNIQEDTYDHTYFDFEGNLLSDANDDRTTNFALGLSVGAKFVTKKGFAFEFFGGVGRNLFSSDDINNSEFVPRLAASFGYRF